MTPSPPPALAALCLAALALASAALGQSAFPGGGGSEDGGGEPAEPKPSLERLDDGSMKIGEVVFDPETRKIRFPAWINQTEGLLEFLVVHENGKIHESLLATDISATNLNVAFKLLRYKASRELYLKLEEDQSLANEFHEATEEQKRESRVRVRFEWRSGDETRTVEARDWVVHAAHEQNMPDDPWVYGGSFVHNGKFVAEASGDLIAIFLSNAALINFAGDDNEDDGVWFPHASRVPAEQTPVTVVIEPYFP